MILCFFIGLAVGIGGTILAICLLLAWATREG